MVAHALAAAHGAGVIHRDIKPSNLVMCESAPGVRILDFGIAKINDDADVRTALTLAGQMVGTPHYIAPEQILDPATVGPAGDVYGMGATMFEMLTGRPPFQHVGIGAICLAHISVPAPDPREMVSGLEEGLVRVVAACLSKRPQDRPAALDLAIYLDKLADGYGALPAVDVARAEISRVEMVRQGITSRDRPADR